MTKPILDSTIVYVVQLVDNMMYTNTLIEKVSCICLVGLFNCEFVLLYYVCVLGMLGIVLKGNKNGPKHIL